MDAESIQQQGQYFHFCYIKDIFFYIRFVEPKLSSVVINRHDGEKKIDAVYEYLLTDHKICTDLWGCRHKIQNLLLVLRVCVTSLRCTVGAMSHIVLIGVFALGEQIKRRNRTRALHIP